MDIRQQIIESTSITEFQRKVYLAVLDVPRGEVVSYGELARRIGCRSAQAVGQALKHNPWPCWDEKSQRVADGVPCHRVVAANGSLGGYFGNKSGELFERKKMLLELEKLPI